MLLLSVSHLYVIGLAVMIGVGFAGSVQMTLSQSLAIEATADEFRARVMSLNMMTFGLMPLGALPMGFAVDQIGAESTLIIVGSILVVATALLMFGSPRLRRQP